MIVVDTSVLVKCILPKEEYEEIAKNLLSRHLSETERIYIPELFYYEISNTLATKTPISQQTIVNNLKLIESFQLNILKTDFKLITKSAQFAKKYKTSFYDMLYAQLAKQNKCKLVTADRKFIAKTNFPHVIHISDYK